ncbi:MAG: ribosome maturation factor RimP [Deltaproteobacteria bacterium]|nr:ribosome maturation factor RimP [Deltaproteobacteria bacterium]
MDRGSKETLRRVREAILPVLAQRNIQLVDAELVREPRGLTLRVFIDREGGITVEDCADFSGEVGDVLDVKGIIDTRYHLEVSSPGLDRRVRDPIDFERFAGRDVRVRTEEPVEGRRNFAGTLRGTDGGCVLVEEEGKTFRIPLENIEKASLKYEWNDRSEE